VILYRHHGFFVFKASKSCGRILVLLGHHVSKTLTGASHAFDKAGCRRVQLEFALKSGEQARIVLGKLSQRVKMQALAFATPPAFILKKQMNRQKKQVNRQDAKVAKKNQCLIRWSAFPAG